MNNQTDDTAHQEYLSICQRVPDKNMLNKTHRKGALQRWDGSNNQNIPFAEEALNNENKKQDKTHHKKTKAIVIGDFIVNNINEHGLSESNKVSVKKFRRATSEKILEEMDKTSKEKPDSIIIHAGTNDLTNMINLPNSF